MSCRFLFTLLIPGALVVKEENKVEFLSSLLLSLLSEPQHIWRWHRDGHAIMQHALLRHVRIYDLSQGKRKENLGARLHVKHHRYGLNQVLGTEGKEGKKPTLNTSMLKLGGTVAPHCKIIPWSTRASFCAKFACLPCACVGFLPLAKDQLAALNCP